MKKNQRKNNLLYFLFTDLLAISSSLFIAFLLRFEFNIGLIKIELLKQATIILLLTKILSFYYFGLYKGMWRYTSINDLINIARSSALGSLLGLSLYSLVFDLTLFPKSVLFIDFIICSTLLCFSRVSVRFYYSKINQNQKKFSFQSKRKNIVIIGAGSSSEKIKWINKQAY